MDSEPFTFEYLDNKYKPLMHKFINKYRIPGYEKDDLLQELRLTLLNAQKLFKPEKGVKFMTYLHKAFDSKMKHVYRDVQGRKKDIPHNRISYMGIGSYKEIATIEKQFETIDLITGLGKEATKISEQILKGNTSKRSWLAAGLSREEIEYGNQELAIALTDGDNPLVRKKG